MSDARTPYSPSMRQEDLEQRVRLWAILPERMESGSAAVLELILEGSISLRSQLTVFDRRRKLLMDPEHVWRDGAVGHVGQHPAANAYVFERLEPTITVQLLPALHGELALEFYVENEELR